MTAQQILKAAANLYRKYGWCQNRLAKDKNGNGLWSTAGNRPASFCVRGAILRVCRGRYTVGAARAEELLISVVAPESVRTYSFAIIEWNNRPGQNKRNIVAGLRRAAVAGEAS